MAVIPWRSGLAAVVGMAALIGGYLALPSDEAARPALALAPAGTSSVTFPTLNLLEHYATVERGVTREHMLTSRAALDAIKARRPVPTGTHVVLVDYQSNELHRYLVAQKTGDGAGDWQYQWFWPDQSIKADENTARCYSCHQSRADRQYLFTYTDALRFK